jgi:hypothetical protein
MAATTTGEGRGATDLASSSPSPLEPNPLRQADSGPLRGLYRGGAHLRGRDHGAKKRYANRVKFVAERLLNDQVYRENLLKRLREGSAPQIEVLLYYYAYGKPRERVEVDAPLTLPFVIMFLGERRDPLASEPRA